jgi:hypothetical protein
MGVGRLLMPLSGAPVVWALLRDDGTPARQIHRALARNAWLERSPRGQLGLVLGFLAMPVVMPLLVLLFTTRLGPGVKRVYGRGYVRQAVDQILLIVTRCVPPPWYYMLELHEDSNRRRALEYIYRFETKRCLYPFLRTYLAHPDTIEALSNKSAFAEHCGRHGVPTIPVLGVFSDGRYRGFDGEEAELPREDLFLKPLRGKGGKGAERWRYDAGVYSGPDGRRLPPERFHEHLEQLASATDYVVRPWVKNHPELSDLCGGVLSTVRILTCRNETGGFEATHAIFKMATRPEAQVDNSTAGAIASRIDPATGELGRATNLGLGRDSSWWDRHPVSGGVIAGRKLSQWNEAASLALRAHATFPDLAIIGWDIALLEDGAFLVEGNKGPGIDLMQRAQREPLGNSRFGELMVFHLERARAERERQLAERCTLEPA